MVLITFSTCWYKLKSKFDSSTYLKWIDNMLSNVNNYNLVIYSDENSADDLYKYLSNPRIKLIIKEIEDFHNYRYKDYWIANHNKGLINSHLISWEVNMMYSEKIHFVYETIANKYFDTEFYGWCDIGYFRGRANDTHMSELINWPSDNKISGLNKKKIYYALIDMYDNTKDYIKMLMSIVSDKTIMGLPATPIPQDQVSVAGGFFMLHKDNIEWWRNTYDYKLRLYFVNDYIVKDDQMILVDCVFSEMSRFCLCREKERDSGYDNWFLFQRYLM